MGVVVLFAALRAAALHSGAFRQGAPTASNVPRSPAGAIRVDPG
jgi:hypothetical protein